MDIVNLIIQLGSGALGGNIAGSLVRSISLGGLGNSIAGLVGGALGSQILSSLLGLGSVMSVASGSGDPDIGAVIAQVAGGGVGGGIMTLLIGLLKQAFQPRAHH